MAFGGSKGGPILHSALPQLRLRATATHQILEPHKNRASEKTWKSKNISLELQTTSFFNGCFNWMIPNHYIKKWLLHQTSIKKWLFTVPGVFFFNGRKMRFFPFNLYIYGLGESILKGISGGLKWWQQLPGVCILPRGSRRKYLKCKIISHGKISSCHRVKGRQKHHQQYKVDPIDTSYK